MENDKFNYISTSIFSISLFRIILFITLLYLLKVGEFLTSFFVLVFVIVIETCALITRISLKKLYSTRRLSSGRVFPEDKNQLIITIKNKKCFPVILKWVQEMPSSLTIISNADENEDGGAAYGNAAIEKYGRRNIQIEFTAQKRGYYKLPDLKLQTTDLFGFFSRDAVNNEPIFLTVYPQLLNLKDIHFNPADSSGLKRKDRPFLLDPIMFAGVREYTPVMPARLIDWKASAHKDILQSKIVESSSNSKILIAVDTKSIMEMVDLQAAEKTFEEALSVAASIAVWADDSKIPFGFIADFTQKDQAGVTVIPVSRTNNNGMYVLEALAKAEFNSNGSLEDMLSAESHYIPWGTTLIVIGKNSIWPICSAAIRQVISYPLTDTTADMEEEKVRMEKILSESQGDVL